MNSLWPLALYVALVVMAVGAMAAVSWILGQRRMDRATGEPFESGIVGAGETHGRFPAKFYLVAMAFVIFDLEAVFVITWAAAFRDAGWPGYLGLLVFLTVVGAGLIYEWKIGALDWSSSGRRQAAFKRRHS